MKKIFSLMAAVLMLASACAANVSDQAEGSDDSLKIVTTIAPLYSLTANLVDGIEGVELSNIVPPNSSVHTYTLTPETAKAISEADLIVINGLELEEFLEDTLEHSAATIVDTSEGVKVKEYEEEGHDEHGHDEHGHDEHGYDEHGHDEHDDDHDEHGHEDDHHEDEHHGHNHGKYDPHIWLSPMNARLQATNVQNALAELDPANVAAYKANLEMLKEKLDALNSDAQAEISQMDVKPYVVFHDAYHYFEENFGIKAAAFLEEFAGKEPSAEYLAGVIDIIEDNAVKVIFAEPQFSPKLVQTLSGDYELTVGELDPLGQSVSKDAYFELIRANVQSLKEAFGQK